MMSIRPWFFFESPCIGFCIWCCISVPGRCSFQRSRSGCCWHIIIGVSFFFITFVFDLFFFRPWLSLSSANSCSIYCSSCGVLAHMSMLSAKRRRLRFSSSIFEPFVFQVRRETDLGLTISADMKVSEQCGNAAAKENQIIGLIRRNIVCKENTNNTAA